MFSIVGVSHKESCNNYTVEYLMAEIPQLLKKNKSKHQ